MINWATDNKDVNDASTQSTKCIKTIKEKKPSRFLGTTTVNIKGYRIKVDHMEKNLDVTANNETKTYSPKETAEDAINMNKTLKGSK